MYAKNVTDAVVKALLKAFKNACPKCLDPEFLGQVHEATGGDLSRKDDPIYIAVEHSFRECKITNILSEDRFSRILKHRGAGTLGGTPLATTVMATHVLAETMAHHCKKKESLMPQTYSPAPTFGGLVKSGWHVYLSEKRSCSPHMTMTDIGKMWAKLSLQEQEAYRKKSKAYRQVEAELVDPPCELSPEQTPWGIGDANWPLSKLHAQRLIDTVNFKEESQKWEKSVGACIKPGNADDYENAQPLCGHLFGPGKCQKLIADAVRVRAIKHTTMLRLLSHHVREDSNLVLICLQPVSRAQGSADAQPQPLFVLLLAALHRDPEAAIFLPLQGDPTEALTLTTTIKMDVELALRLADHDGEWQLQKVEYALSTTSGPAQRFAFTQLRMVPLDLDAKPQAASTEDKSLKAALDIAHKMFRAPRQESRQCRRTQAGSARNATCVLRCAPPA